MKSRQELFDYFPEEVLKTMYSEPDFWEEYYDYKAIIHTSNPWDLSLIESGMPVITRLTGVKGKATDYHTTDVGKANGCIEVEFADGSKDYFYPHQLKKDIDSH
ncbi:hypothetical protein [Myxosarcina sp. GI1(2024)]